MDSKNIFIDKPDLNAARAERQLLSQRKNTLQLRAKALAATRRFFDQKGFMEVNTPVRIPTPPLEDYIEAIPSGSKWLRTSPEFHMKRLIAAGYGNIYQIGPCFRRDECGKRHLVEFTMLEWYRTGGIWLDVLQDTMQLLEAVARETLGTTKCRFRDRELDLSLPWEQISVEDAFRKFADCDLDDTIAKGKFEEVLVEKVEPHLGINGRPTALTEYPLACSGLSKQIPGNPNRVERWEVYVAGLELGNACSELADPVEQTRRFRACAELRHREQRDIYDLDQPFLDAIRVGMPDTAGVAIGMDRLFMLITGINDIAEVNPF